jgi:predicted transcriptional regulator
MKMSMATDVFSELFGSKEKARLIRYFLFNTKASLTARELAQKTELKAVDVRQALRSLGKVDFVSERMRKRRKYYILNDKFPYISQLLALFSASNTLEQCKNLSRLRKSMAVKYAAVSGLFTGDEKAAVDIFIVVSDVRRARIDQAIRAIEAEVGKEIRYVLLDIEEFRYRIEMLDRFLKDFFECNYEEIVNRIAGFSRVIQSLQRK